MKMHGPDQNVALIAVAPGVAPGLLAPESMTLSELYDIIRARLEYCRLTVAQPTDGGVRHERVSLETLTDIDALTQQCMVEVRKKLRLHKDDLDYKPPADPPLVLEMDPDTVNSEALRRHLRK